MPEDSGKFDLRFLILICLRYVLRLTCKLLLSRSQYIRSINACVFNAADSLYAKTAQNIFDSIQIMHDRAKKWITIIKNAHASSFIANEDGKCKGEIDVFKDVKLAWPGAIELLEVDGEWLKKVAASDFPRTSENEIAYYGSLAVKRATSAAKASLESYPDVSGAKQLVIKRSHVQDEALRKQVNAAAALHVGPIELCDEPDWREFQLLKLLKRIRKHRVDRLMTSESCCARCDGFKTDETSKVVTMLRSDFKRTIESTRPRIAASRMACFNSRELNAVQSTIACTPLEAIDRIATDSMVSVRGSRIHGWGLYADHPFQEGDIVAEYIGEYVSDAVADLRERRYREQRIQDYQFRIDGSLVSCSQYLSFDIDISLTICLVFDRLLMPPFVVVMQGTLTIAAALIVPRKSSTGSLPMST